MRRLTDERRLDIVASQQIGFDTQPLVTAEEAAVAAWAVTADGTKVGGARAIALALATGRSARWPMWAWAVPGVPWLLDQVYGLVALNRRRLPGESPWCIEHPDDCVPDPAAMT
ncbi:MAG: DUF393 domain-containing protein [Ilumatobacter sp.]|nr:DUF393 domain-containing protein [Ilumatobacter sp.]MBT5276495.1 DUF393 domain-containing protein [Ilumatobacter sp.]MBT5554955.1 DUF393 domain-containing protein [Ilumatobacter sp.]MBT5865496.1 DUF393 domain-containing protein [Ilumatobacter sp.]MBT7430279.1 DUF393 domain-containing protein [Ilumatobacter sp.]